MTANCYHTYLCRAWRRGRTGGLTAGPASHSMSSSAEDAAAESEGAGEQHEAVQDAALAAMDCAASIVQAYGEFRFPGFAQGVAGVQVWHRGANLARDV